ncbi:MAG: NADPH-Fe(3+) oxidoreductase subunit alpha [Anaerolineales bacterium]|nr:NADPH-Fe(3+) oxidoreductase subunit alpha [Anaerolineales bacterium]
MCVVSVEKARGLQTACTTPVAEGMIVETESEAACETRQFVLEMLLTDHPNDCMTCEVNGDCKLQDLVYDYGVEWPEPNGRRHVYPIDPDPNPFVFIDLNKCILCSRCVRACEEIQNRDVWSFAFRGFETKLVAGTDQPMLDARCESCGQCVAYCPVGALYDKMSVGLGRPNQVEKVRTTCSYCGVGCNFDLNVRNGEIVRVTSAEDAPVNGMALCVKGRYGYDYVHHRDRLTRPLVRAKWLPDVEERVTEGEWTLVEVAEKRAEPTVSGNGAIAGDAFIETDWGTALDVVAGKFAKEKQAQGGDAFSVFASAKCTNEENYLFSKFTRQVLGTNSIDHCARL